MRHSIACMLISGLVFFVPAKARGDFIIGSWTTAVGTGIPSDPNETFYFKFGEFTQFGIINPIITDILTSNGPKTFEFNHSTPNFDFLAALLTDGILESIGFTPVRVSDGLELASPALLENDFLGPGGVFLGPNGNDFQGFTITRVDFTADRFFENPNVTEFTATTDIYVAEPPTPIPEPGGLVLVGIGLVGFLIFGGLRSRAWTRPSVIH